MWHELLPLEIELEFKRLCPPQFDIVQNALWQNRQYDDRRWTEFARWWKTTTAGRRYDRELHREKATRLKAIKVEIRTCIACGRDFEVSAYRISRNRTKVCSTGCKARCRSNIKRITIDGVTKTLSEWSLAKGLKMQTVWMRLSRGWDIRRALGMPAVAVAQKGGAK